MKRGAWNVAWRGLAVLLPVALSIGSCKKQESSSPSPPPQRPLNVAAAADLKFALDEVASQFRQSHPDIDLRITYGSSGNFFAQLSNHAPFDLFLSANVDYPRKLIEKGLAEQEFIYGTGRIVIWVRRSSKLDVQKLGFDTLSEPSIRKIAIANPEHAPYGQAAEAALRNHQLWESLHGKIALGEDIAQTAQFVQSGAADAGIIALSLAMWPQMNDQGKFYLIPSKDYPPLRQEGVILSYSPNRSSAGEFRDFLATDQGRLILRHYGFAVEDTPAAPAPSTQGGPATSRSSGPA